MTTEVLRLGLDTRGMEQGQRRASRALTQVRADSRGAAGSADGLTGALDRTGVGMRNLVRVAGMLGIAIGVAGLTREMRSTIGASSEFEASLMRLQTLVGIAEQDVASMGVQIRQLSVEIGVSAQEMSTAMFAITSGGARGAEAMELLEQSSKAAAIGLGNTRDIGRLAGAAVQAFGDQGLTASAAIDIMVATIREGNMEASELASVMGSAMGPAAALGVSMEEVGGFIATYTRLGVSAAEATTSLQAAMTLAISPTQQARDAMREAGFSVDQFRAAIQDDGLANALVQLIQATGGNIDTLGEFIPNVRALRGILGTAGVQGEEFERIVASIGDSVGITNEGFEEWSDTAEATFARFSTAVEAARLDFGERFLPLVTAGIEKLTQNLDLATDAAVGLSIALGGLVALKVGLWASGAAVAFGGWITAFGGLALGVKSLSAALALLQVAIGPVGWVIGSVSVITAGVMAWRRATRDAADEQDALRDSTRSLTERLDEQTDAFQRLTDAQLQSQIAQREARAEQIRSQMQELEGQLAVGAPAGTTENLDRHREALAAEEEAIRRINGILLERHAIEGVTTQTVREREQAQRDAVNGLREHIALLTDALDLDVQTHAALETALDLRDGIRSEIDGGVASMERLVELLQDEAKVQEAITRHMERRIGLEKESLRIAEGITNRWGRVVALQGGPAMNAMVLIRDEAGRVVSQIERMASATDQVVVSTGALEGQYSRINSQAEDAANQSIDWAQAFDDHWQTAIHSVGASLGGVASQIANVAGAFASGGPMAGLAAGAGMFLGEIFGQGVSRFEEAASEWEAALDDFVDMFADPSRWNRMRDQVQGAFDEHLTKAILSGFVDTAPQVQAWADTIQRVFTEIQDAEGIDAAIEAVTGIMRQLGASTEQIDALTEAYRDNIAAIEAQRQAAVGSMTEELQIRQLVAQGMDDAADAMRLEIERRKEMAEARELEDEALVELLRHTWEIEDAFREAADATRALREARDEELSLTEREAALRGDDRGALHARLQRQAESELNALQDRLDAGRISEDHFQRIADLISGEVNQALADYEEAQRASMQALQDDIAVRELLVAGMDDEAAALRLEIRQRQELAEAMALAGDASDDLIERLRALHDAEREGLGSGPSATAEVRRAATQGRSDIASVTGITEASALRLQDIGLSQLQRLTAIEFNTSALRGGAFQPSGVAGRPTQGGIVWSGNVVIHTTGDVTPAGARALGTEVVNQMDQRFGRKMRRDGRLAGDMGVPR